jgi:23S rRNA (guanine745-N1)-methyltransferase
MVALRCTVRGCDGALSREEARLICPSGHAYDRARSGYWNLLQPHDRRSIHAGDRDDAVLARRRWLGRGFAEGLARTLGSLIDELALRPGAAAIDVGCGEGTLAAQVCGSRALHVCGVDLATPAIRLASRLAPQWTWIVANADRGLPFADGSVDLAMSIFGRRPAAELHRVVRPRGALIVVVPAEDDLIELREAAQGEGIRRDRAGDAQRELSRGFDLVSRRTWRHRVRHDRQALEDALAMSYRGVRGRERERLFPVTELDVTLSAEILWLVPRDLLR